MTKKEKLNQVNRICERHGFHLLSEYELDYIANNFGSSEYNEFYWNDLCYVKHYGKHAEYVLYVHLDYDRIYMIPAPHFRYNLCLSRSWFSANIKTDIDDEPNFKAKDYEKYFKQAKRAYKSLNNELWTVSSNTED